MKVTPQKGDPFFVQFVTNLTERGKMDRIKIRLIIQTGLVLCMLTLLWGCNPAGKGTKAGKASTVADTELSLRKGETAGDSVVLAAPQYSKADAGDSKKIDRAFYDAPPMVPHDIEGMVQTKEENECLDCHEEGDEDTPGVSPSHRIKAVVKDLRGSQSQNGQLHVVTEHAKVAEGINNERYNCSACHVPQATNLVGLVENDFGKTEPSDAKKDVLNDLNSFEY